MVPNIAIGIDVGGSHVTAYQTDLQEMKVIPETYCRLSLYAGASTEEILDVLSLTISESRENIPAGKLYLGMAMPGPFDYQEGICLIKGLGKYDSLYGLNVKKLLAERLLIPSTRIRMMNDATAFLKGEMAVCPALTDQRVAGITLGTGLGSALYQNGQFEEGNLYQLPYLDGVAEDYISTRWFINHYNGNISGVKELADRYPLELAARNLFTCFGENLARVLLAKFPPGSIDVLIIGGNIAKTWDYFYPSLRSLLEINNCFMEIRLAQKGEQATVLGAAALWK